MGIIKRVKGAVSSKANAALDRAIDPHKEMDIVIMDLDAQYKKALKELLSYKTTAKQMEQAVGEHQTRAKTWETRAMIAIKSGDDDTAKECLKRKKQCDLEVIKIKRDQAEAAGYAAELNNSRKVLDSKLKMLKLRKGTIASQLAASRSGKGDVFAQSEELFDKMDEAERLIDEELFAQQAEAELAGDDSTQADFEIELLKASRAPVLVESSDDPLLQLKARMASEKKQLKQ